MIILLPSWLFDVTLANCFPYNWTIYRGFRLFIVNKCVRHLFLFVAWRCLLHFNIFWRHDKKSITQGSRLFPLCLLKSNRHFFAHFLCALCILEITRHQKKPSYREYQTRRYFPGRVLGLGYSSKHEGGLDWAPYSPDLNPCDFFLWGYLKDQVYRRKPRSIEEVKEAVAQTLQGISQETLKSVIGGFETRLHAVIEKEGAHIEPYLH